MNARKYYKTQLEEHLQNFKKAEEWDDELKKRLKFVPKDKSDEDDWQGWKRDDANYEGIIFMTIKEYLEKFRSTIICYQNLKGKAPKPFSSYQDNETTSVMHTFAVDDKSELDAIVSGSTVCFKFELKDNIDLHGNLFSFTVYQSEAKLGLSFKKQTFSFLMFNEKTHAHESYSCHDYEGTFVLHPREGGFKKLSKGTYYLVVTIGWCGSKDEDENERKIRLMAFTPQSPAKAERAKLNLTKISNEKCLPLLRSFFSHISPSPAEG